jgi:hypothetical protein
LKRRCRAGRFNSEIHRSESWRQVELEHSAPAGSLERSRVVEQSHCIPKEIDAEGDTRGGDASSSATEKGRRFAPVPGDAAVGEKAGFAGSHPYMPGEMPKGRSKGNRNSTFPTSRRLPIRRSNAGHWLVAVGAHSLASKVLTS